MMEKQKPNPATNFLLLGLQHKILQRKSITRALKPCNYLNLSFRILKITLSIIKINFLKFNLFNLSS